MADINTSGFNYKLPDGTVIQNQTNSGASATVDTIGVLSGRVASPIPDYILKQAKAQLDVQMPGWTQDSLQAGGYKPYVAAPTSPQLGATPLPAGMTTTTAGVTTPTALAADPNRVGVPQDGTYAAQTANQVDQNYYFKPGESLADYTARTQAYISQQLASQGLSVPQPSSSSTMNMGTATGNPTANSYSQAQTTQPFNASSVVSPNASVNSQGQQTSLTTTESDIQKRIDDLMKLNDAESGKAAYQTEQNKLAGVPGAQGTVDDLQTQLNVILNEATQIKLTTQPNAGVTTQIDSRQRDEALRKNAITALSVSSLLDAAKGSLASAQRKANLAVEEKFGPIEAQIKAATDNLNLILNSPQYSVDQKNIALAQQQIQNQMSQAISQQKSNFEASQQIAIDAAANLATFKPTSQYSTAAQALQAIQQADPVTAQRIASETGLIEQPKADTPTPAGTSIINSGGRQLLINDLTGETIKDLGASTSNTPTPGVTERLLASQQTVIQSAAKILDSQRSTSTDGYSNPDSYRKAKQDYIAAGGTAANFFQSFPVETYISPENRKGDLSGATSQSEPSKTSLSLDQQSIINDAKSRLDMAKQRYEDFNAIRSQIIQQSIQQYGFDPSPYF